MLLAPCAVETVIGVSSMKKSWKSTQPKGIEEYLKDLCLIYRGEMDNPHDVNALLDEERAIQFLRYSLWDAVKKKLERVKEFGIDLTAVYHRFVRQ